MEFLTDRHTYLHTSNALHNFEHSLLHVTCLCTYKDATRTYLHDFLPACLHACMQKPMPVHTCTRTLSTRKHDMLSIASLLARFHGILGLFLAVFQGTQPVHWREVKLSECLRRCPALVLMRSTVRPSLK